MAVVVSLVVLFAPSGVGTPVFPGADKVVHLLLFAALAATTRWRFGAAAAALGAVAGYAVLSEVLQATVLADRSGDAYDVAADLLGAVGGWLLARRLVR